MKVTIEKSWGQALAPEFEKPYFRKLSQQLHGEKAAGCRIYPPGPLIFKAFDLCPLDKVKVVILGQDPYHGQGQAMGLSFSVPDGVPAPPSLKNIFKEIASLFPSQYINIGGDEVETSNWKYCPDCQALMKKMGYSDEKQLMGYFVERLDKIIHKLGKKMGGWHDIVVGNISNDDLVVAWKSRNAMDALDKGFKTIMQPAEYCYMDMKYSLPERGHTWAAVVTMEKIYSFDPTGTFPMTEEQKKLVAEYGSEKAAKDFLREKEAVCIQLLNVHPVRIDSFDDIHKMRMQHRFAACNGKSVDAAFLRFGNQFFGLAYGAAFFERSKSRIERLDVIHNTLALCLDSEAILNGSGNVVRGHTLVLRCFFHKDLPDQKRLCPLVRLSPLFASFFLKIVDHCAAS